MITTPRDQGFPLNFVMFRWPSLAFVTPSFSVRCVFELTCHVSLFGHVDGIISFSVWKLYYEDIQSLVSCWAPLIHKVTIIFLSWSFLFPIFFLFQKIINLSLLSIQSRWGFCYHTSYCFLSLVFPPKQFALIDVEKNYEMWKFPFYCWLACFNYT